jgi:hypothetical protein
LANFEAMVERAFGLCKEQLQLASIRVQLIALLGAAPTALLAYALLLRLPQVSEFLRILTAIEIVGLGLAVGWLSAGPYRRRQPVTPEELLALLAPYLHQKANIQGGDWDGLLGCPDAYAKEPEMLDRALAKWSFLHACGYPGLLPTGPSFFVLNMVLGQSVLACVLVLVGLLGFDMNLSGPAELLDLTPTLSVALLLAGGLWFIATFLALAFVSTAFRVSVAQGVPTKRAWPTAPNHGDQGRASVEITRGSLNGVGRPSTNGSGHHHASK